MALISFKCKTCGKAGGRIVEGPTKHHHFDQCPSCMPAERRTAHARAIEDLTESDYRPEELALLQHNTRCIEKEAENILSGATVAVTDRGPSFLKPKVPEHLSKKYW